MPGARIRTAGPGRPGGAAACRVVQCIYAVHAVPWHCWQNLGTHRDHAMGASAPHAVARRAMLSRRRPPSVVVCLACGVLWCALCADAAGADHLGTPTLVCEALSSSTLRLAWECIDETDLYYVAIFGQQVSV